MDGIDVWWIRVGDVRPGVLAVCEGWLAPAERERAARLRREEDRQAALLGRALVRAALSRRDGRPPAAWEIGTDGRGRPELVGIEDEGGGPWGFSLSHSSGAVACAVGRGREVGVDVERVREQEVWDDVAARVFSATERVHLDVLDPEERCDRACALWSLKEAYAKARGLGLALPFDQLGFEIGANGAVVFGPGAEIEPGSDPSRWSFLSLVPTEGFRLAACWSHGGEATVRHAASPESVLSGPR